MAAHIFGAETHTIYVKGSIQIEYLVHLFVHVLVFFGVKFVFSSFVLVSKRRGRGEADSQKYIINWFCRLLACLLFVVCEWQFLFCSVPTVIDRLQCNVNVHSVMDRIFGKNQPIMKKI